jgi:1,4-dihydroxy-2-naphthoyl-CoA hydrolase
LVHWFIGSFGILEIVNTSFFNVKLLNNYICLTIRTIMSDLEKGKKLFENTLMSTLGMELISVENGKVVGTMPVDERTVQPFRILHGGASAALAETLGSLGSNFILQGTGKVAVGLEINANHIKSAKSGIVTGVAELIHQGRTTHVWNITITNDKNELVCLSRLTMLVKEQNG